MLFFYSLWMWTGQFYLTLCHMTMKSYMLLKAPALMRPSVKSMMLETILIKQMAQICMLIKLPTIVTKTVMWKNSRGTWIALDGQLTLESDS